MQEITEKIQKYAEKIQLLRSEIAKKVVGQSDLIDALLIGVIGHGHILLEGVPGLAKTLTVKTLSQTLDLGFNRVQFTPDLLPSDLLGTEIFNTSTHEFEIKKGPIFNNFILADEINRAPSKVQSALLEAMEERHITIGKDTFPLEEPFVVLATQNPIEQSGTYELPEAQLDRFLLKVTVDYPEYQDELEMYKKNTSSHSEEIAHIFSQKEVLELQGLAKEVFISENIYEYVMNIINASRFPEKYSIGEIASYIEYGFSPRGGLSLLHAARVYALLQGREYVIPEDIKHLAPMALGHRLVLSYEAIAEEKTRADILKEILNNIEIV